MSTNIQLPKSKEERSTRTTQDCIEVTPDEARGWPLPPFQRPLRVNPKVRELAIKIGADGGIIPGVLTFGVIKGKLFLLDGQHRREAFLMSGKAVGYVDTRTCHFETMSEMGVEFVRLNSSLARLKPDDILRGLEDSTAVLRSIRKACPFVGYDNVRRGDNKPVLSMSAVLRSWSMARQDVPSGSTPAAAIADEMQPDEANNLIGFLLCAMEAWGRDHEYYRLWGAINLTLCMWLFRRTTVEPPSGKVTKLTIQQFRKGLTALSASGDYMDWLVGRILNDVSRAPGYRRITDIMKRKLSQELSRAIMFPAPSWSMGRKTKGGT